MLMVLSQPLLRQRHAVHVVTPTCSSHRARLTTAAPGIGYVLPFDSIFTSHILPCARWALACHTHGISKAGDTLPKRKVSYQSVQSHPRSGQFGSYLIRSGLASARVQPSGFGRGRVRKWHCCHSLPSEPDVKVSLHPAQAAAKPRYSGAGGLDGFNPASRR